MAKREGRKNGGREKPISLKFIANHLGLSVATISAVLNETPASRQFSAETRERVLKAAQKFDYRPNFTAQSLRRQRSYTIAVIVPEISEGYTATLMAGIEDRLLQDGYLYFVASHHCKKALLKDYPRLLLDRNVEGFILVNTPVHAALPLPSVSIASPTGGLNITDIRIDNEKAARQALRHLTDLGHREVAFFKGHPGSADTEPRWNAICKAAREVGIVVREEMTVQLRGISGAHEPSTPEEGYLYAEKLMRKGKWFSALFAFNDVSAMGAISAFEAAGRRVPEQVSVVGFDDVMGAKFYRPPLTTVRQPLYHMGELAASCVLSRISGPDIPAEHILVDPELVVRESTAPAARNARRARGGGPQ